MDLYRIIASQVVQVLRALPGASEQSVQRDYIRLARKIVCYNQGKVADYSFLVDEAHKELKFWLNEVERNNSINSGEHDKLKQSYQELSRGLMRKFKAIALDNFEFIQEIYSSKSFGGKLPRICVKSATPVCQGEEQDFEVVTLASNHKPAPQRPPYLASQSVAFSRVLVSGEHYICNDIPRGIKEGKYFNSRINTGRVLTSYRLPQWHQNLKFRHSKGGTDEQWPIFWSIPSKAPTLPQLSPTSSSFYKSTLIIPLSFSAKDGDLSNDFLSNFDVHESKIVLGFLCLDHENIDFFNEKEDVEFSYILADLLALYLIKHWTCTVYSRVFERAGELLRQRGFL